MYGDGGGLYLRVTPDRAKNWVFVFMLNGRARWMGMGPLQTVSLLEARKLASERRWQRHDGIDPIEARRAERLKVRLEAAKTITFKECAEGYIKAHRAGWRNGKHASNGKRRSPPMPSPLSASSQCRRLTPRLCSKCWSRSGRKSRKRPAVCADVWSRSSIGQRCAAIGWGKTRPVGKVISITCCRRAARCRRSSTTPHCPTPSCRASW